MLGIIAIITAMFVFIAAAGLFLRFMTDLWIHKKLNANALVKSVLCMAAAISIFLLISNNPDWVHFEVVIVE
ncbi:hypothetical protein [Alkalimonas mucilaginosa]|uniref:Uncharacterized protein n=1 Tax=Alkalimonas mucilaginosa TaxID=3057676 RepID=A0ABU7JC40_9GAMM|nr:hypothetical protein [Alkalimonas sp. MEB004]MEE2023266.1 hypothetical protein [Alkalimonas sp. MEB004]